MCAIRCTKFRFRLCNSTAQLLCCTSALSLSLSLLSWVLLSCGGAGGRGKVFVAKKQTLDWRNKSVKKMSSSAFGGELRIDPVTVTVSALSCGVFFMLVVLLLLLLYKRVPFCCRTGSSRQHTNAPPHYHSRDALIGCVLHDDGIVNRDMVHYQTPGGLFVIGKPRDYHLPGPLPRLPSYESVRRKDRRTHIHHMITQRFGLSASPHRDWEEGCVPPPPPPSYEDCLRQPLEVPFLGSLRRLDDEAFPAQDQDDGQPGPSRLTSPRGVV